MDRHITYIIDELNSGISVKDFLKSKNYASQTISDLKHIKDGIMHNGKRAYVTENLETGDKLNINIYEEQSSEKIPPIEISLDILYEDDDLIIVNKPSDMPVHPSLNNYENTLANGLAYYYEKQGEKFVFRCMNRLDRNTTGTVLVAKNAISGAMLSSMIRDRQIQKEYVAITDGIIDYEHYGDAFTINEPIGRVEGSTIERCVDYEKGERAVTHVRVLKRVESSEEKYTVVSCNLETGRTHQIRVHMGYIGHPLEGDGMYNPKYRDETTKGKNRQLLHCRKLQFTHPITGREIIVEAPYPMDMIGKT